MDLRAEVVNFITMFVMLVLSTFYLRWRGILSPAAAPAIARLITEMVLPALLVRQLASVKLDVLTEQAVVATLSAEIVVGACAFIIAKYILKLALPAIGVFVLCSTFGSTALIGNALIKVVFKENVGLTAASMIIGQLATGLPNNLIGPAIMMRCGKDQGISFAEQLRHIILNPTFLSIQLGLAWSFLGGPTTGSVFGPVFSSLKLVGDTLPFLVAVLTGLSIQELPRKQDIGVIVACSFLLLIAEPAFVNIFIDMFGQPKERQQLTFLLAAMPASPLTVAFAVRYGGDIRLASILVLATTGISAFSIPALMPLFDQFRL